jgi:hypothetical protein
MIVEQEVYKLSTRGIHRKDHEVDPVKDELVLKTQDFCYYYNAEHNIYYMLYPETGYTEYVDEHYMYFALRDEIKLRENRPKIREMIDKLKQE